MAVEAMIFNIAALSSFLSWFARPSAAGPCCWFVLFVLECFVGVLAVAVVTRVWALRVGVQVGVLSVLKESSRAAWVFARVET